MKYKYLFTVKSKYCLFFKCTDNERYNNIIKLKLMNPSIICNSSYLVKFLFHYSLCFHSGGGIMIQPYTLARHT